MGRRGLDIVLMNASSLMRQYHGYRMVVHAQAYITNDSMPVQYTTADRDGDVNPRWDHPLTFILDCSYGGSTSSEHLNIELINTMPDGFSSVIGSLTIPLVRFLSGSGTGATSSINDSWPVSTGGRLYFSYRLGAYVSRVRKIVAAIARIVLGSTITSLLGFELNYQFGHDDNN